MKLLIAILTLTISFISNAFAATASSSLSNYTITFSGPVELFSDNFYGNTYVEKNGESDEDFASTFNFPDGFNLKANLDYPTASAHASADYANSKIATDSTTVNSFIYATTNLSFTFAYQANSTISFSVDSFVNGSGLSGDFFFSAAEIGIYADHDGVFDNLYGISVENAEGYNKFKTLSINYQSPDDGFITVYATSVSMAGFTNVVPEPKTYSMILAGLVILGFASRKRLEI